MATNHNYNQPLTFPYLYTLSSSFKKFSDYLSHNSWKHAP